MENICVSVAWLGWTIAPVSRLKMLPPSATGMPGVGFWREVAQKVSHTWTRKRMGYEVTDHTDLKFQSLIYNIVNISTDSNTAAAPHNDVLLQNCVLPS